MSMLLAPVRGAGQDGEGAEGADGAEGTDGGDSAPTAEGSLADQIANHSALSRL